MKHIQKTFLFYLNFCWWFLDALLSSSRDCTWTCPPLQVWVSPAHSRASWPEHGAAVGQKKNVNIIAWGRWIKSMGNAWSKQLYDLWFVIYMTFTTVCLREIRSANPPARYMSEAALKPESLFQRWIARQSSNFVLSNNWTSKRRGFGTCLVPIFGLNISSHGFQILFSELSTTSGTHTAIHELGQAINQGVGLCFALSHGYLQKFLLLRVVVENN